MQALRKLALICSSQASLALTRTGSTGLRSYSGGTELQPLYYVQP